MVEINLSGTLQADVPLSDRPEKRTDFPELVVNKRDSRVVGKIRRPAKHRPAGDLDGHVRAQFDAADNKFPRRNNNNSAAIGRTGVHCRLQRFRPEGTRAM